MTRLIKFRKQLKKYDDSEWEWIYFTIEKPSDLWTDNWIGGELRNLCQFTGLLDKNKKEIYEGDIVKDQYETFVINPPKWFECDAFDVYGYDGLGSFHDSRHNMQNCEVIGNIHENTNLLP